MASVTLTIERALSILRALPPESEPKHALADLILTTDAGPCRDCGCFIVHRPACKFYDPFVSINHVRFLHTAEGAAVEAELAKPAVAGTPEPLARLLQERFPALGTDEPMEGADTVQALCSWYEELTSVARCTVCGKVHTPPACTQPEAEPED